MPIVSSEEWAEFLVQYPDAHLLQTPQWGQLKGLYGWRPIQIINESGVQILLRHMFLGFYMAYIPKGPLEIDSLKENHPLIEEIDQICKKNRVSFLKIEPDVWETQNPPDPTKNYSLPIPSPRYKISPQSIQPQRTLTINLVGNEESILNRMKSKTRYNIKLASKRGVSVHPCYDIDEFYNMMIVTGERDQFGIHSRQYFEHCYHIFKSIDACELFIAEHDSQSLAGVMVFASGKRSWYFYGASINEKRDYMPTYAVQWTAICWAKSRGCVTYDLWGVPDENEDDLEKQFLNRSDGLWSVYRFKRGFSGKLCRNPGPWDRVYNPIIYALYRYWISRNRKAMI